MGIISESIWGSFQGWGSFRGRDHFGGCTDTIIAKARYTTSLHTLISTTGLSLQVWCLGRVYPFIHQVAGIFFLTKNCLNMGGWGEERKGTPFLSAIKNKTLDLGFGLCVCTTSKGAEKCRQLVAKPPLVKCWVAAPRTMRNSTLYSWWGASCQISHLDEVLKLQA